MVDYVEEFTILNRYYGIEDARHNDNRPGQFMCWVGGCGIGPAKTRADARVKLHNYAVKDATRKRDEAQAVLNAANEVLERLSDDSFNLSLFRGN